MKFETYEELMDALRFKEDMMIHRATEIPKDKKTEEERTRYIRGFDPIIKRIKLARRELKRDTENFERYALKYSHRKRSRL